MSKFLNRWFNENHTTIEDGLETDDLVKDTKEDIEFFIRFEKDVRKHEREKVISVLLEVKENLKRGLKIGEYPEEYKRTDEGNIYFIDRLIEYINRPELINKGFGSIESKCNNLVGLKLRNLESELEQGEVKKDEQ